MVPINIQESEVLSPGDPQSFRDAYKSYLDSQLADVQSYKPTADMLGGKWSGLIWPESPTTSTVPSKLLQHPDTGVELDVLRRLGQYSVELPAGFVSTFVSHPESDKYITYEQEIHSRLKRHVKHRLESLEKGAGIDWATAEALAWGSLMREGHDIRISGQDVGRGTFSHRYAYLLQLCPISLMLHCWQTCHACRPEHRSCGCSFKYSHITRTWPFGTCQQ